jgi:acetyl esterase/lipase
MGRPYPPFDPELAAVLAERGIPATRDLATILRSRTATPEATVVQLLAPLDLVREDRLVPGEQGGPDVSVSVLRRRDHAGRGAGLLYLHGGAMLVGDRFHGIDRIVEWVHAFDAVAVTVEYRLAPEHPYPAAVHDCFAALKWAAEHASELGFDARQLVISGLSAGGGLAAGVALLARDRGGPSLAGQILMCPMLDDRDETVSALQMQGVGVWDRASNQTAWRALLGDAREVPVYAAPARATDLTGLPPAYIDCGTSEVFRDEAVAYASALWAAGVSAELHVWAGGFHGFDGIAPKAAVSVAAKKARTEFLGRLLKGPAR